MASLIQIVRDEQYEEWKREMVQIQMQQDEIKKLYQREMERQLLLGEN